MFKFFFLFSLSFTSLFSSAISINYYDESSYKTPTPSDYYSYKKEYQNVLYTGFYFDNFPIFLIDNHYFILKNGFYYPHNNFYIHDGRHHKRKTIIHTYNSKPIRYFKKRHYINDYNRHRPIKHRKHHTKKIILYR